MKELKEQGYVVEPTVPPDGGSEEAVANALLTFNVATRDRIQSVSFANVTNVAQASEAEPSWVIYLTHVPEAYVGGPAQIGESASASPKEEDPIYATMAIFMDPDTMHMRWAVQY